ncbi:MAG: zinc-ribbon domain-containing protein [Acutalibacteraceae bacterium]
MEEKKKKQYVSDNAQLMAEWHPTKNNTLLSTQVASKSGKKVWWKCNQGHEWQGQVYYRTTIQLTCPICARKK